MWEACKGSQKSENSGVRFISGMKGSGLNPLDTDMETSILEGLLDKFGTAFSIKQIANAYCKARRDANFSGAMLYELSNSKCILNKLPKSHDFGMGNSIKELLSKVPRAGFQHVIRKNLGWCGYNLHKEWQYSNYWNGVAKKRDDFFIRSRQRSTHKGTQLETTSRARGNWKLNVKANGPELPRKRKGCVDIQHKLSVPFHARTFRFNAVKKSKGSGKVVVKASTAATVECKDPPSAIEDDKSDYGVLRRAVKEHRAMEKEYCKYAIDALAKGDRSLYAILKEEAQFHSRKAREADEESAAISFGPGNKETEDSVTLYLHESSAKEELIGLLKCHLSALSGIQSMKFLKVIFENDEDTSKGSCRRQIVKLLEKESIAWSEGEKPGTMLIPLEEINPKRLSFARK